MNAEEQNSPNQQPVDFDGASTQNKPHVDTEQPLTSPQESLDSLPISDDIPTQVGDINNQQPTGNNVEESFTTEVEHPLDTTELNELEEPHSFVIEEAHEHSPSKSDDESTDEFGNQGEFAINNNTAVSAERHHESENMGDGFVNHGVEGKDINSTLDEPDVSKTYGSDEKPDTQNLFDTKHSENIDSSNEVEEQVTSMQNEADSNDKCDAVNLQAKSTEINSLESNAHNPGLPSSEEFPFSKSFESQNVSYTPENGKSAEISEVSVNHSSNGSSTQIDSKLPSANPTSTTPEQQISPTDPAKISEDAASDDDKGHSINGEIASYVRSTELDCDNKQNDTSMAANDSHEALEPADEQVNNELCNENVEDSNGYPIPSLNTNIDSVINGEQVSNVAEYGIQECDHDSEFSATSPDKLKDTESSTVKGEEHLQKDLKQSYETHLPDVTEHTSSIPHDQLETSQENINGLTEQYMASTCEKLFVDSDVLKDTVTFSIDTRYAEQPVEQRLTTNENVGEDITHVTKEQINENLNHNADQLTDTVDHVMIETPVHVDKVYLSDHVPAVIRTPYISGLPENIQEQGNEPEVFIHGPRIPDSNLKELDEISLDSNGESTQRKLKAEFEERYTALMSKHLPANTIETINNRTRQTKTLDRYTDYKNRWSYGDSGNDAKRRAATLGRRGSKRRPRLQPKPTVNDDHLYPNSVTPSKVERGISMRSLEEGMPEGTYNVPYIDDDAFLPKKLRDKPKNGGDQSSEDSSIDYDDVDWHLNMMASKLDPNHLADISECNPTPEIVKKTPASKLTFKKKAGRGLIEKPNGNIPKKSSLFYLCGCVGRRSRSKKQATN